MQPAPPGAAGEPATLAVDRPDQLPQRQARVVPRATQVMAGEVGRGERVQPCSSGLLSTAHACPERAGREQLAVVESRPAGQRVDVDPQPGAAAFRPSGLRLGDPCQVVLAQLEQPLGMCRPRHRPGLWRRVSMSGGRCSRGRCIRDRPRCVFRGRPGSSYRFVLAVEVGHRLLERGDDDGAALGRQPDRDDQGAVVVVAQPGPHQPGCSFRVVLVDGRCGRDGPRGPASPTGRRRRAERTPDRWPRRPATRRG